MVSLILLSFELADRYRNPVILLGDGMLGQMMEPLVVSRPKKKLPAKPWALTGCKKRAPNVVKSLYLREGELEDFNKRLQKKYEKIENGQQRWEDLFLQDARIILVAYGSLARIARSVVMKLRKQF